MQAFFFISEMFFEADKRKAARKNRSGPFWEAGKGELPDVVIAGLPGRPRSRRHHSLRAMRHNAY